MNTGWLIPNRWRRCWRRWRLKPPTIRMVNLRFIGDAVAFQRDDGWRQKRIEYRDGDTQRYRRLHSAVPDRRAGDTPKGARNNSHRCTAGEGSHQLPSAGLPA